MLKEQLNKQLKQLHEELSNQVSIDNDTKGDLVTLMDDIERLLNNEPEADKGRSLIPSLEKSIDALEEKYPRLTMAIQEILTTLSNMGI